MVPSRGPSRLCAMNPPAGAKAQKPNTTTHPVGGPRRTLRVSLRIAIDQRLMPR
jgi:hypothetical protein